MDRAVRPVTTGPSGPVAPQVARRGAAATWVWLSREPEPAARANTASSMGSVSRPVKVFCWLTWYEHTMVREGRSADVGTDTSSPWANRGRGRTPTRALTAWYPIWPSAT